MKISKEKILALLNTDLNILKDEAYKIKLQYVGSKVYFRGLIEYSNICNKNCYYCGIRKDNKKISRYEMTDSEVLEAANFADKAGYGSLVIQTGERTDKNFIDKITKFIIDIKKKTNLGITLSCGEQSFDTYKKWFEVGAHRYLLRIETSNDDIYKKLHPNDALHSFKTRVNALENLKKIGYQTGSGIMVGLPYQELSHIASDILFLINFDVDMIGLGPYIEHSETPLYEKKDILTPIQERFNLALKVISILRILMKDINIASATALQSIDPEGREKALLYGANVIMPNLTPTKYRDSYLLYENKPCTDEDAAMCKGCLERRITKYGETIAYNEWGDPKHYFNRKKEKK